MTDPPTSDRLSDCDLSIAIPCLDEAATIDEVLGQLERRYPRAEILVVDDGCTDATCQRVLRHPAVRLLRHEQNRGYGAAIRTACEAASRPYIVWFDGDGQHDAEMIAKLLANLPHSDCAIGARCGKAAPWTRRLGVAALCWLARLLTWRRIPDLNCGLRAFRREVLGRYLHLLPQGFSASATTTIVMLECGYRVAWTPIPALARAGSSRLRPLRDGARTLALIVRLVVLLSPWKVFLPLACGSMIAGLVAGLLGGGFDGSFGPAIGLWLSGGLALLLGVLAQHRSRRWRKRLDP